MDYLKNDITHWDMLHKINDIVDWINQHESFNDSNDSLVNILIGKGILKDIPKTNEPIEGITHIR